MLAGSMYTFASQAWSLGSLNTKPMRGRIAPCRAELEYDTVVVEPLLDFVPMFAARLFHGDVNRDDGVGLAGERLRRQLEQGLAIKRATQSASGTPSVGAIRSRR